MLLWTIIIPTFSFLNVIFFLGLMSVVGIIGHLESCDNFLPLHPEKFHINNLHSYFLCQNLRTQNPACVKKLQISGTSFKKLQWKVGVRGRVYWINRLCINFTQIKYLLRNNNTTRWIFVGHGYHMCSKQKPKQCWTMNIENQRISLAIYDLWTFCEIYIYR